ncbi:hypothetical protein LMG28688_00320 [Paraburkholderia caffeinitolerans]|uniref:Uncharacterized protein n=1 Tax=Paraburkholderia caffeinitolerans TaxID=1723730 RepID=A0A6J5FBL1_9BURK|nr:hypothetical protein LMG28688_00320 [Paraburkholderia caffeinitolerans]
MATSHTRAHRLVKPRKLGWAEKPIGVVPLYVQSALRDVGLSDADRP